MDLLVVGAGSMGRWFASATADAVDRVAFADVAPDAAALAARGAREGDGYDDESVSVVEPAAGRGGAGATDSFDAVCVAVPMPDVEAAIADWAPLAGRAVVDVAGVMGPPIAAMAEHAAGCERVSLHPLFAPENEPGNVAVVADEPGAVSDRLLAALADRGNELVETTADDHDAAMATVQAGAHAAILAFGLATESAPAGLQTPVSAALEDLVDTVTAGDPAVYAHVQSTYDGADAVAAAAERLAAADEETFEALHEQVAGRTPDDPTGGRSGRDGRGADGG